MHQHPTDWPCLKCTVEMIQAYDQQQARSAAARRARVLNRQAAR